jgi:hypothetical protein
VRVLRRLIRLPLIFGPKADMEQEVYRHVPYDIDVEQALLGAILVDNQAIERVSMILKAEHFYDPLHAAPLRSDAMRGSSAAAW